MKKMTEKQAEAMKAKITKAVMSLPFVYPCGGAYEFRLETKYGLLRISPCETAIRTRFDDVPQGVFLSGPMVNPFSGKWNFEFGERPTQEEIDYAVMCIKEVLV